jgi:hypothetical protein
VNASETITWATTASLSVDTIIGIKSAEKNPNAATRTTRYHHTTNRFRIAERRGCPVTLSNGLQPRLRRSHQHPGRPQCHGLEPPATDPRHT